MLDDRLLLVGAGIMGQGYVRAAGELGLQLGLVERQDRFDRYRARAAILFKCDADSDEHWVAATVAAVRSWRPDHVVAFAEPQVLAAGFVQDLLGLPGPSLRAAVASRDKALQRTLLQAHGVRQPEFAVTRGIDEALEFADSRYPVVVKALRSSGSRGVVLAADAVEVRAIVTNFGVHDRVLVESFVDGPEYSCELLVRDERIVFRNYTRKLTTGAPEFVEIGHVLPVSFGADQPAVDGVVSEVVAALGIRTSLVHLEFRLAHGHPYMLETAVRTPGDHIMEMLSHVYECDMYAQVLNLYLGNIGGVPRAQVGHVAIRYLQPRPGRFLRAEVPDDIPGLIRLELPYRENEMIGPLRCSADRGGYVIARASSEDELVARMAELASTVNVITV